MTCGSTPVSRAAQSPVNMMASRTAAGRMSRSIRACMKSKVLPPRARRRRQDCRPVMPPTTKKSGMTCRTQTTGSNQRWLPRVLSEVTVPSGCSTGLTIMVCDTTTSARQKNLARSITRSRSGRTACPLPARCRGTIEPLRNLPTPRQGCWAPTPLCLPPLSALSGRAVRPVPLRHSFRFRAVGFRQSAAPAHRVRRRAAASRPAWRPHGGTCVRSWRERSRPGAWIRNC